MAVRGSTTEERQHARAKVTCERRATFYVDLMTAAVTSKERLQHACAFLRAVAKDLADNDVDALAAAVTRLADERNLA